MEFYSKTLWKEMNSLNYLTRRNAERQWRKADKDYLKRFEMIKHLIPEEFLLEYSTFNGFHDFLIVSIDVLTSKHLVNVLLFWEGQFFTIEMRQVTKVQLDFLSFKNCICGKPSWGYSEFATTSDGNLRLSVLSDIENECVFEFKTIVFYRGEHNSAICEDEGE